LVRSVPVRPHIPRRAQAKRLQAPAFTHEHGEDHHSASDDDHQDDDRARDDRANHDTHDHDSADDDVTSADHDDDTANDDDHNNDHDDDTDHDVGRRASLIESSDRSRKPGVPGSPTAGRR
jgi:hypothetical protein